MMGSIAARVAASDETWRMGVGYPRRVKAVGGIEGVFIKTVYKYLGKVANVDYKRRDILGFVTKESLYNETEDLDCVYQNNKGRRW
ncbi:Protein of unknown function [Gryllus bimaculatus]|nr:Protein of unknown function [Gryllus bimaculatus]